MAHDTPAPVLPTHNQGRPRSQEIDRNPKADSRSKHDSSSISRTGNRSISLADEEHRRTERHDNSKRRSLSVSENERPHRRRQRLVDGEESEEHTRRRMRRSRSRHRSRSRDRQVTRGRRARQGSGERLQKVGSRERSDERSRGHDSRERRPRGTERERRPRDRSRERKIGDKPKDRRQSDVSMDLDPRDGLRDRRSRRRSRDRSRSKDRSRDRRKHRDSRSASPLPYRPFKRRDHSPSPPRRRRGSRSRHKRQRPSRSPSPLPRSRKPLLSQEVSFRQDNSSSVVAKEEQADKQKPNFAPTGLLAREANTVAGTKIALKYHEPPEARKPPPSAQWRLFVFKGPDMLQTIELHTQSCWLLGRAQEVADILVAHPSCSQQHAAIQFRYIVKKVEDEYGISQRKGKVKPYVIDLESLNGTMLNGDRIEGGRYVELRDGDLLKFGGSEREYVVMLPPPDIS